jgi:hypothetical protein
MDNFEKAETTIEPIKWGPGPGKPEGTQYNPELGYQMVENDDLPY